MNKNTKFIIDFDSTFVKCEAIDVLADIVLENNPKKEKILNEIIEITKLGMEGKLNYSQSLAKRLKLLSINKIHIEKLIRELKNQVTPSIKKNKEFIKNNKENIYLISGGFKDYINPVVEKYGILEKNIFANEFLYSKEEVVGFNKRNILSRDLGKQKLVKALNLEGEVFVLGDGYTDYEIKRANENIKFFSFSENISRKNVVAKSDFDVRSFDEMLFQLNLKGANSYPKSKMKVLLLENIHRNAVDWFKDQGYKVEAVESAVNDKELCSMIKDVSILGIRSKTIVNEYILKNANKLLVIGAFCIGTNQIDLAASTKRGISVFNAPYSNTRSVVELTIGEIIMLSRNIIEKNKKLHEGIWDKSAKGSNEIRGKKLGIIGYGNIGTQLGIIAESLGMSVNFFDISEKLAIGNAKKSESMAHLLKTSDIITIHVDGRQSNKKLISESEFKKMKNGVIFLNLSRGSVVDLEALYKNIINKKIRGAAIDVFPEEPNNNEKFVNKLQNLSNVILTPHIGGSTQEAQENIGEYTSKKITEFIDSGNSMLSVNFPNLELPKMKSVHRLIHIHNNTPGVLAKINTILSNNGVNIQGQYLNTNELIGYAITDINKEYSESIFKDLKNLPETIKIRILY